MGSFVPSVGLEPTHLSTYAPKAYVATNYTMKAFCFVLPERLELSHLAAYAPKAYVSTIPPQELLQ